MKVLVTDILKKSFSPEFLNRVDEVVVFHSLTRDNIIDIARLQLQGLSARMRERRLTLDFKESAVSLLAEEGYDINYGARPLKRVIQNMVETPLAKELISGSFGEGDTVVVDEKNGEIVFAQQ